jgi:hypothetical protein
MASIRASVAAIAAVAALAAANASTADAILCGWDTRDELEERG